jgi:flagellar basal-body rod modification protein FlgD
MESAVFDPLAASATHGPEPTGSARQLGRDDFLRLLVAKLENQDPMRPAQDTEFVAQLATFSSLEQLINVNDNLAAIGQIQDRLINAQALNLIGKEALVESGGELRIKQGQPDTIVYAIPRTAKQVTLTLFDSNNVPVRSFELETVPSGRRTLEWDGSGPDGEPLPDGDYRIEVNAVDPDGEPMTIALFRSLRIDGVSFVNGTIGLVSGDREIPFDVILEIREGL